MISLSFNYLYKHNFSGLIFNFLFIKKKMCSASSCKNFILYYVTYFNNNKNNYKTNEHSYVLCNKVAGEDQF